MAQGFLADYKYDDSPLGLIEIAGYDLWELHDADHFICVTTNGDVNSKGEAIMGKGTALQASQRFPDLPAMLGEKLDTFGNHLYLFPEYKIITYPTKNHWAEKSDIELIKKSFLRLQQLILRSEYTGTYMDVVYLPRPGVGSGGLQWEYVKPRIELILDERVIVVSYNGYDIRVS